MVYSVFKSLDYEKKTLKKNWLIIIYNIKKNNSIKIYLYQQYYAIVEKKYTKNK